MIPLAALSIDGDVVRSQPNDRDDDDDHGANHAGSDATAPPSDPAARRAWLAGRLDAAIAARPQLARARVAFHVVDVATKQPLASRDGERGLNLASNTKVLTSAAALAALGSGFRWRTAVFCVPPDKTGEVTGDLYIRGRGDPVLSVEALDGLAQEVAARGVRSVNGRLVVDASYFDGDNEPPHFHDQPAEQAAFRAPVASFAVARSAFTVVVMPEPGGGAAKITIDPPLPDYLKLARSDVSTIDQGRSKLELKQRRAGTAIELEVTGQIRNGQGTWDLHQRVDDPTRFAAEVFRRALAHHGVKVRDRALGFASVPIDLRPIAVHDSPTLGDVLRAMNKHSDNNVAETMLKTLGAETRGTPGATWKDGLAALRDQLAKLGVAGMLRIENGSGLYAASEVSAKQLASVLVAAHADYRIGPDLIASLPVGGYDGTLARRFKGHPAQGRVRAKTGTLDRVTTLGGFVATDSLRPIAFAILVNDIPPGQRPVAKAMIDDMVDSIATYLDAK